MLTTSLPFGRFNFLFNQTSIKLNHFFEAYQSLLACLLANKQDDELSLTEFHDSEQRRAHLLNKLAKSFNNTTNDLNLKSVLHYNWTNEFISKIYFTNDSVQIKIELAFYDQKIQQLNNLTSFIWSNYSLLNKSFNFDNQLVDYLKQQIQLVKINIFNNNDLVFNDYLAKKGFNLKEFKSESSLHVIIKLGCLVAFLFAPCEPLDPFEYDLLVDKCQSDELSLTQNETNLTQFIKENKLKTVDYEPQIVQKITKIDFYFKRANKSDYFFLKNEFENALKQFCSERLVTLCDKFTKKQLSNEEEYKNLITTLEKFITKITNEFYSYSDVVYLPINGLALIGYGLKELYTQYKTDRSPMVQLVQY